MVGRTTSMRTRATDWEVTWPGRQIWGRSSITVPNNILTIGHMTKFDIATQGKSTTKQRIPNSVDDPRLAYYPIGNWLGDVPSSHRRRHNHRHLPCSLLHSLTKLIAMDKVVSTFWNCTHKPSKRKVLTCCLVVARIGSILVCPILTSFSCRYRMSYDISISLLKNIFVENISVK
jgi:hypothetical protein